MYVVSCCINLSITKHVFIEVFQFYPLKLHRQVKVNEIYILCLQQWLSQAGFINGLCFPNHKNYILFLYNCVFKSWKLKKRDNFHNLKSIFPNMERKYCYGGEKIYNYKKLEVK